MYLVYKGHKLVLSTDNWREARRYMEKHPGSYLKEMS